MNILEVTEVTDEIVSAFHRLIPQLSANTVAGFHELNAIVRSPCTVLFIAREEALKNRIVGTLTLATYRTPSGLHAWVEDVVVDDDARGRGVGESLCRVAIDHARSTGASSLDLTSRPSREAANRLYLRLGFVLRKTNVYRYSFETE